MSILLQIIAYLVPFILEYVTDKKRRDYAQTQVNRKALNDGNVASAESRLDRLLSVPEGQSHSAVHIESAEDVQRRLSRI